MRLAQVTINQLKFQMANRLKTRLLTDVIAKFHTECNMGDFLIERFPCEYQQALWHYEHLLETMDVPDLIGECRKLEREFANTFYLDTSKKTRMMKLKTV